MLIIAWQISAVLVALYDHFMIHSVFVSIEHELYSFPLYLLFNMTAALVGGVVAGPLIIFWINDKYIHKPYGQTILLVVLLFMTVTSLLILIMGVPYINYTTGIPIGDSGFWGHCHHYIFNPCLNLKLAYMRAKL